MPEPSKPNHPWDNAGPMDIGLSKDFAPKSLEEAADAAVEDQLAFDKLGPETRKAMKASPIRWSAAKALEHIQRMRANPLDRRVDRMMAEMIRKAETDIVKKIRVSDEQAVQAADPHDHIKRIVDRAMKPRQRAV